MGDSPQTDKLPWQQEALNLVWKQKAPRSWQVFSGKKALLPYNYYGYAAFGLILLLCPLAAFLALNLFTEKCSSGKGGVRTCHPPLWPNLNVSLYWLVVGGIIVALLVATGIISRLMVARKKREDPQPLVIVLPEGWVHYLSPSNPIDAIAFGELTDLRGKTEPDPQEVTTLADLQRGTAPSQRSASDEKRPATSLHLQWREDKDEQETWSPHECFGPPEPICAAILGAYARYGGR